MKSIHSNDSNDELTVVQRWLLKFVEATKERAEEWKREEERARKRAMAKRREPKAKPKKKPSVVAVAVEKKATVKETFKYEPQIKGQGFVYLMRSGNGYHKIGISKNVQVRRSDLNRQFPIEINIVHAFASNNYRRAERILHEKYSSKRIQYEWFNLEPHDIQWIMSLRDYDLDETP